MPIVHQLRRIPDQLRAVEKIVDPVRGVGQVRFGLDFIPSIGRHDSEDERVALDVVIGMNGAGHLAVALQQTEGGQAVDELCLARSYRLDQFAPSRNRLVQRLAR